MEPGQGPHMPLYFQPWSCYYVMMLLNTVAPSLAINGPCWENGRHTDAQQSMKEEYTGLEPQTSIMRTSPTSSHHNRNLPLN